MVNLKLEDSLDALRHRPPQVQLSGCVFGVCPRTTELAKSTERAESGIPC